LLRVDYRSTYLSTNCLWTHYEVANTLVEVLTSFYLFMMEMMHTNYIEMMIILNGFRFSYVYVYWNVNVYVEMMIIMIILNVYVYIEMWRL